jgi:hypothetical protein
MVKKAVAAEPKKPRKTMYVPEGQRHTERIVLRLAPEVAARIRELAKLRELSLAELVTEAIATFDRKGRR